jgi:hypothetical protein
VQICAYLVGEAKIQIIPLLIGHSSYDSTLYRLDVLRRRWEFSCHKPLRNRWRLAVICQKSSLQHVYRGRDQVWKVAILDAECDCEVFRAHLIFMQSIILESPKTKAKDMFEEINFSLVPVQSDKFGSAVAFCGTILVICGK